MLLMIKLLHSYLAGEWWLDSVGVKGVSIQHELVVVDHLLNLGRKGRFLFFLGKESLHHIKFQGICCV